MTKKLGGIAENFNKKCSHPTIATMLSIEWFPLADPQAKKAPMDPSNNEQRAMAFWSKPS